MVCAGKGDSAINRGARVRFVANKCRCTLTLTEITTATGSPFHDVRGWTGSRLNVDLLRRFCQWTLFVVCHTHVLASSAFSRA
jgi:hypothetical protein